MRKRRWRRWLAFAVLAIVVVGFPLAFGVSNLFLVSPKGRAYVAARIQRTIQLETRVQGSTWSPWNGFTVYGLFIEQPAALRGAISAPMLTAESIRIHPDWGALLKRQIAIRGIDLRKPDGVVAIELLSQIPTAIVEPPVAAKPPDLAVAEPPPGELLAVPERPERPESSPQAVPAPPTPTQEPAVVTEPTVWVKFTDARLKIVSVMTKEPLYRISRMDGGLPIGGKSAASELVMKGISTLGYALPGEVKIPLKWNSPFLDIGVIDGAVFGIEAKLETKVALTPGMPFLIGGGFPKQEGKEIVLSPALRARMGSIAGQGRLQGLLLAPSSWQGQWIVQSLSVETDFAGHQASFDQGQALVMFQGGALRCLDARLIGQEASVLGNGMVLSDGRFAANLRIVAAPESLISISKFTQPDSSQPRLTPLATPQRAALDMRVFGVPGNVFYQANPAAKPVLVR